MTEQQDKKPQWTWRRRAGWAAVLALGVMSSRAWAEVTATCSMFCYPCSGGLANAWGYCCQIEGNCPCWCGGDPRADLGLTNCSDCAAVANGAMWGGLHDCGCTNACSYTYESPCFDPDGGGGGDECSGTLVYTWTLSGWVKISGFCTGYDCMPPDLSGSGCNVGDQVSCDCATGECSDPPACPPPGPCDDNGGDGDGDGCCADVDCDDGDPQVCTNCGQEPCESQGGDADEDGCCDDVDHDSGDPEVCTAPPGESEEGCGTCEWVPSEDEEGTITWSKAVACTGDCECEEPAEGIRVATTTPCKKPKAECNCSDLFPTRVAAMKARLLQWWPSLGTSYSYGSSSWTLEIPFLGNGWINVNVNADPASWGFGLGAAADWLRAFVWAWSMVMVVWLVTSAVVKDLSGF